jgi:hypothetical protein
MHFFKKMLPLASRIAECYSGRTSMKRRLLFPSVLLLLFLLLSFAACAKEKTAGAGSEAFYHGKDLFGLRSPKFTVPSLKSGRWPVGKKKPLHSSHP